MFITQNQIGYIVFMINTRWSLRLSPGSIGVMLSQLSWSLTGMMDLAIQYPLFLQYTQ